MPGGSGFRHRSRCAEPEVVFRIVHVVLDDGFSPAIGSPPPPYREQTVEVALGPNPTFRPNGAGALTRQVPPGQVVHAVPPSRRKARQPKPPRAVGPPRIVETLRRAIEWRRKLDAGEVPNQAAIARLEGLTRARVTQVLMLLHLRPEIQEQMLAGTAKLSERILRPIASLDTSRQKGAFFRLLGTRS